MRITLSVLNAMLDRVLTAPTRTRRTSHCENEMLLETAGKWVVVKITLTVYCSHGIGYM